MWHCIPTAQLLLIFRFTKNHSRGSIQQINKPLPVEFAEAFSKSYLNLIQYKRKLDYFIAVNP